MTKNEIQNIQKIEINSFEDMESFIEDLKVGASDSLVSSLNAQLQVIRYASSPQLVSTMFDSLIQNIKKSKEYANSKRETDLCEERGSLMIHNFVFFMKAKLVCAAEENEKEGLKLLEEAGKQLSSAIFDLALVAATKGTNRKVSVKNLFENLDKSKYFFGGLMSYVFKKKINEKINKRKEEEFYETLKILFSKLEKRKDIIGKSNLIAGLVDNYKDDLIKIETTKYYSIYQKSLPNHGLSAGFYVWSMGIKITVLSGIILFFRWIWYLAVDTYMINDADSISREGWAFEQLKWTGWFIGVVALVVSLLFLFDFVQTWLVTKIYNNKIKEIREYYENISKSFEE